MNPFEDIGRKPISAREAVISKKIGREYQFMKAHKFFKNLLTPTARRRLVSLSKKNRLWADPDKLKKYAEEEFDRMAVMEELRKPPKNRWVLLKGGPYRGQWRRVIEQRDLFSQNLYLFVVSSNLSAIAYNKKTNHLEIEFKGGSVYRYANVPYRTYKGLANAGSKGKYFWRNIRGLKGREPIYSYSRLRFRKERHPVPEYVKKK